jgi:hypothetical protein
MKAIIFILLLILIACEKDDPKNWKCTLETTEVFPGQVPVVKKYVGYPMFTDKEMRSYQRQNTNYGYNIVDNDTIGIIVHSCNCVEY